VNPRREDTPRSFIVVTTGIKNRNNTALASQIGPTPGCTAELEGRRSRSIINRPSRTAATLLRRERQASTKPVMYTTNEYQPVVAGNQDASAAKVANRTASRRKRRPGQTQPLTTFSFFGMSPSGNTVTTLEPHYRPAAPIINLGSAGCPGAEVFQVSPAAGKPRRFQGMQNKNGYHHRNRSTSDDPSVFDRRQWYPRSTTTRLSSRNHQPVGVRRRLSR
jgi:hypothetical protein